MTKAVRAGFIGSEGNRLAADIREAEEPHGVALLLHGGGQTRHAWDATAKRLATRGVTSITLDARGHGQSEWVSSKAYSFKRIAADLAEVTTQVTTRFGEKPVLIGASMGGLAAMLVCESYAADLFRALILVDITPQMEQSGVDRILGFMAERSAEGFASVEEAAEAIAAYLPNRARPRSLDGLSKNLRRRDDGRWYWHWDPAFVSGPEPIESEPGDYGERLTEGLRRARMPILLVRGSRSELVSEAAVKSFMATVPHARFADVAGAGHMVAGDRNDVFAQAVTDFLERDVFAASR